MKPTTGKIQHHRFNGDIRLAYRRNQFPKQLFRAEVMLKQLRWLVMHFKKSPVWYWRWFQRRTPVDGFWPFIRDVRTDARRRGQLHRLSDTSD